ncbi:MAG: TonB-dependent receptor [Bacteroidales bacterium]|nr:TonB-dependent receptor [Bacteroidales bacterium]
MKYTNIKLKLRAFLAVLVMLAFAVSATAQKISLTGVVRDAVSGETILGANILEKGTTNGTITNLDGEFSITVSPNATLVIKYVGYKPQEIPIAGQKNLVIRLQEDAVALGEVVAIGYGTVKKNDATGSITAIKPDKLNKGLTTNAQDMLSGKIAGVNVTSDGGIPGGGATIRIRGGSSLNASNDPLIVIDGLTMDNNGVKGVSNLLSTINPNDIESFTVLKDASATAIYGSRASNGVVLITTKKGVKNSKPRVAYDGNFSVSTVGKTLDVMNGDEYRSFVTQLFGADSKAVSLFGNSNTDWQSQIYQTALSNDHNINVTGGLKNMPYRASFGYTNQNGVIKTSNFERYTGAINLSPSFFDDHLKVNINAKGMFVKNRYADTGVIGGAAFMDPTQSVTSTEEPYVTQFGGYWQWINTDANGNFTTWNNLTTGNPVATLMLKRDVSNAKDFIGNAEFDYKFHFLPELRAHLNLGTDIINSEETFNNTITATANYPHGYDGWEKGHKSNSSLNFYLQYNKEFSNQKFDLMGGYEWQHFYRDGSKYGIGLDGYVYSQDGVYNWATEYYLVSFFGRLNYSIADKYLFTATLRNDGTSRFASNNRWGLFPSAAFAWKINEESFLRDNNTISDLKLRLGYGITGQQDINQGDYPYIPVYQTNDVGAYYQFGDTYYGTARPNAYNPSLKWEETTTYNTGLDLGLLNNRFTASIDYYYRETSDLLNSIHVPVGTNFSNVVLSNIGSLTNQGIEFSVNAKAISTEDYTLDLGYNVTYNYNKITKLTTADSDATIINTGNISDFGTIQAYKVGFPTNSFYVYQQVYSSEGKPIQNLYVDRNGDGQISSDDMYLFHKSAPDVTMGFFAKLIYKDFDLGMSWRASIGNYVYNDIAANNANLSKAKILMNDGLNNKPMSAFETNFSNSSIDYKFSDYYIENGSFLRCDNLTVGYSFKNLFKYISSGRISATVQNPFVITKYKGIDPEVYSGIDNNIYPRPVVTVIGLSLNF